jgi:hypothetical protein
MSKLATDAGSAVLALSRHASYAANTWLCEGNTELTGRTAGRVLDRARRSRRLFLAGANRPGRSRGQIEGGNKNESIS